MFSPMPAAQVRLARRSLGIPLPELDPGVFTPPDLGPVAMPPMRPGVPPAAPPAAPAPEPAVPPFAPAYVPVPYRYPVQQQPEPERPAPPATSPAPETAFFATPDTGTVVVGVIAAAALIAGIAALLSARST